MTLREKSGGRRTIREHDFNFSDIPTNPALFEAETLTTAKPKTKAQTPIKSTAITVTKYRRRALTQSARLVRKQSYISILPIFRKAIDIKTKSNKKKIVLNASKLAYLILTQNSVTPTRRKNVGGSSGSGEIEGIDEDVNSDGSRSSCSKRSAVVTDECVAEIDNLFFPLDNPVFNSDNLADGEEHLEESIANTLLSLKSLTKTSKSSMFAKYKKPVAKLFNTSANFAKKHALLTISIVIVSCFWCHMISTMLETIKENTTNLHISYLPKTFELFVHQLVNNVKFSDTTSTFLNSYTPIHVRDESKIAALKTRIKGEFTLCVFLSLLLIPGIREFLCKQANQTNLHISSFVQFVLSIFVPSSQLAFTQSQATALTSNALSIIKRICTYFDKHIPEDMTNDDLDDHIDIAVEEVEEEVVEEEEEEEVVVAPKRKSTRGKGKKKK